MHEEALKGETVVPGEYGEAFSSSVPGGNSGEVKTVVSAAAAKASLQSEKMRIALLHAEAAMLYGMLLENRFLWRTNQGKPTSNSASARAIE